MEKKTIKFRKFRHYGINEIKEGHQVQLMLERSKGKGSSMSAHYRIKKIDPPRGRLLGVRVFSSSNGSEKVFMVDEIYRNYTVDPISPDEISHKTKKAPAFTRTPK